MSCQHKDGNVEEGCSLASVSTVSVKHNAAMVVETKQKQI